MKTGKSHQHQQMNLFKVDHKHRYAHGGVLRKSRKGRKARPLSSKDPLHVVLKVNQSMLKPKSLRAHQLFKLTHQIIDRYSKKFFVKVEQISIHHDHIHLLLRTTKRSFFQSFFRVVGGQMAQQFGKKSLLRQNVTDTPKSHKTKRKLWSLRPFSRVITSYRAYQTVKNYIQLNEKEVKGLIKYSQKRLKGLSMSDWELLWV